MPIARDKKQPMFQRQCRYPKVVVGDRSTGAFELNEEPGIPFSRRPSRH